MAESLILWPSLFSAYGGSDDVGALIYKGKPIDALRHDIGGSDSSVEHTNAGRREVRSLQIDVQAADFSGDDPVPQTVVTYKGETMRLINVQETDSEEILFLTLEDHYPGSV